MSLLNFLDFDGLVTRFVVGNDVSILSVYPDGFCLLRSTPNSGEHFYRCFHSFDFAMKFIVDLATIDSLENEKE